MPFIYAQVYKQPEICLSSGEVLYCTLLDEWTTAEAGTILMHMLSSYI